MKERQVLRDLIKTYRSLPCLWDQTDSMYTNKRARDQGFDILLEKFRDMEPEACVENVKRKLENMRAAYRREFRKVLMSKRNGSEEYVPSLWYFKELLFLDRGQAEAEGISVDYEPQDDDSTDIEQKPDSAFLNFDDEEEVEEPRPVKRRKQNSVYIVQKDDASETFAATNNIATEAIMTDAVMAEAVMTEAQSFGRTVGLQLNNVHPMQKVIAEKLISDIIYYARLNKLSQDTVVQVNEDF